jgi:hypothetical protein
MRKKEDEAEVHQKATMTSNRVPGADPPYGCAMGAILAHVVPLSLSFDETSTYT